MCGRGLLHPSPGCTCGALQAQKTARLCIVRDLTEHDIVARIMRKDNYLIGMLNRGVLALHVSVPGSRRHFMLTKTLEWNLCFCIFSHMFDSNFRVQSEFVHDVAALRRRFRCALSPTHLPTIACSHSHVVAVAALGERLWHQFSTGCVRCVVGILCPSLNCSCQEIKLWITTASMLHPMVLLLWCCCLRSVSSGSEFLLVMECFAHGLLDGLCGLLY